MRLKYDDLVGFQLHPGFQLKIKINRLVSPYRQRPKFKIVLRSRLENSNKSPKPGLEDILMTDTKSSPSPRVHRKWASLLVMTQFSERAFYCIAKTIFRWVHPSLYEGAFVRPVFS